MNPTQRQRIPYELRPGSSWDGVAIQTNELESMGRDGYLTCAVYHSHTLRPTKRRILITAKDMITDKQAS